MVTTAIAVIAVFIVAFGLISGRIQKTPVTAPMIFVGFGLLIGESGLGLLELDLESELVDLLAEFTLILVLFVDASRINLKQLREEHDIPVRLLSFGLPLTIVLGALLAVAVFPGLGLWEAAVLAIMLAPTDAALGQAVVSSPKVPVRIRQALNVESGLNDGIALPALLFFLSVSCAAAHPGTLAFWGRFALMQLTIGPLVGIAVGYLGGRLVSWGGRSGWMTEAFQSLSALGLALSAYALAEIAGGNGFIAAFAAGLTIGNIARPICSCLHEFGETQGQLLALLTFMVFGAVMVEPALNHFSIRMIVYAVLSLTVVRMLPVTLSLLGLRLRPATHLFVGWFGPRGVATIIYGLIVLKEANFMVREEVFAAAMIAVLLSVALHGLSAWPGTLWYSRHAETLKDRPDSPEHRPVSEMPARTPMMH